MNKIIFVLLFVFINQSHAIDYFCHIDTSKNGMTLTNSNVSEHIRKFTYSSVPGAKGKRVKFNGLEVIIFNQANLTSLILKDTSKALELKTSYELSQKEIKFIFKDRAEVKCLTKELQSTDKITKKLHQKLERNSNLADFAEKIYFKNKSTLKFKYNQQLVSGLMRPIIFQDGNLLTADDKRRKDGDWCVFQIQVKLNEDTYLQKYTQMKPLEFSQVSNNEYRTVYNYSFVDFSNGRKSFETSRYALFSLSCNLNKGAILTPAIFHHITGDRFEITLRE